MKRLFLLFCLLFAVSFGFSQVKFMGIPVDGDAYSMIAKIKAKGFVDSGKRYDSEGMSLPVLKGTFNGVQSRIYVYTNKKKVYRVYVRYYGTNDKGDIVNTYNRLIDEFLNSKKYSQEYACKIRETDDIDIGNKVYQASFHQYPYTEKNLNVFSFLNEIKSNDVWFRIYRSSTGYYISIYYDNLENAPKAPNGEDL